MSQHLRWTPEDLQAHLTKRLGANAAARHPSMAEISRTGPSNLERALSLSKSSGAFVEASVRSLMPAPQSPRPSAPSSDPLVLLPSPDPAATKSTKKDRKKAKSLSEVPLDDNGLVKTRIGQRERSIASLKSARCTGVHVANSHLELRFHGVVLLSVNTLYGLSHFQRVKYRKAWHELVETAVAQVVGEAGHRHALDRYVIHAHRVSRRLADTDAKSGYLKYPIDGLRYSGILVEDTEDHFRDFFCTQSIGEPALILRIEAVGEDYVPVAQRNPWVQSIQQEFARPLPDKKKAARKAASSKGA